MARIGQLAGPSCVGIKRHQLGLANPTRVQARSIDIRTNVTTPRQPACPKTDVCTPLFVQAAGSPAIASLNIDVQFVHTLRAARIAGRPSPAAVAASVVDVRPCHIVTGLWC